MRDIIMAGISRGASSEEESSQTASNRGVPTAPPTASHSAHSTISQRWGGGVEKEEKHAAS